MSENTTIIVSKETRDTLKTLGRKSESYDAILVRLIDDQEKLDKAYEEIGFLEARLRDTEAEG